MIVAGAVPLIVKVAPSELLANNGVDNVPVQVTIVPPVAGVASVIVTALAFLQSNVATLLVLVKLVMVTPAGSLSLTWNVDPELTAPLLPMLN